MRILLILMLLISLTFPTASAQIRGEVIEYKQGDTVMEGYLAYDDAVKGKRAGILVVHDWNGIGSYVRARAQQLASLGYIAFAPDIYGKNLRPADNKEAAKIASALKNDRLLLRLRVNAGLDILRNHPLTDSNKLGAIGYCFGGMTVRCQHCRSSQLPWKS